MRLHEKKPRLQTVAGLAALLQSPTQSAASPRARAAAGHRPDPRQSVPRGIQNAFDSIAQRPSPVRQAKPHRGDFSSWAASPITAAKSCAYPHGIARTNHEVVAHFLTRPLKFRVQAVDQRMRPVHHARNPLQQRDERVPSHDMSTFMNQHIPNLARR